MGIANVANMVSHLQNASRARLGLTSVPYLKYNLAVALAMHRAGFLSFVARGGPHPPDPAALSSHVPEPLTTANIARQRLWLGLKYDQQGRPLLWRTVPISKPKRAVTARHSELGRLVRGFPACNQEGLNLGETLYLSTDRGTLEAREALERRVGGLLLCRACP
ncbi:ribosomal protein S8 [Xylariaceae sp. FL0804]|nr:ribosomal protein S8 [Xylariaceae sp. FL0804]